MWHSRHRDVIILGLDGVFFFFPWWHAVDVTLVGFTVSKAGKEGSIFIKKETPSTEVCFAGEKPWTQSLKIECILTRQSFPSSTGYSSLSQVWSGSQVTLPVLPTAPCEHHSPPCSSCEPSVYPALRYLESLPADMDHSWGRIRISLARKISKIIGMEALILRWE